MTDQNVLVEMRDINKQFAHVYALNAVNFEIRKGEVHSLLGENGAGKSTLIKILTGVYTKDSGTIVYDGREVEINSREAAANLGIACVYQELSLVPTLTVAQNVMLHKEIVKFGVLQKRAMNRTVDELIKKYEFPLKATDTVETLSVAQKQMVEILKALSTNASLIVMDEPTASLSSKESATRFKIIEQMKARGVAILYISHRLEEVFQISDRITVLRNGQNVGLVDRADFVPAQIIKMMIGKELSESTASHELRVSNAETVLKVEHLTHHGAYRDVSFELKKGEVLVLSGLVGSGRTEILRSIFGVDPIDEGTIIYDGKPMKHNTKGAIMNGLGLIPEDRRTQGFAPLLSGTRNVAMTNYEKLSRYSFINSVKEKKFGRDMVSLVDLRPANPDVAVGNLSGGNQQKIVLGKWLTRDLKVMLVDEPTVGIDIGAKDEIYNFIEELASKGVAVLLVSSDIAEVLRLATRIIVMRNGSIYREFNQGIVTQEDILMATSGIADEGKAGA